MMHEYEFAMPVDRFTNTGGVRVDFEEAIIVTAVLTDAESDVGHPRTWEVTAEDSRGHWEHLDDDAEERAIERAEDLHRARSCFSADRNDD